MRLCWLAGWLVAILLSPLHMAWGQDKPPIELPEVVIVGQDVRTAQQEKRPIGPRTIPIGLQSELQAGKVPNIAPPDIGRSVAGPTAENPGCLLFSGVGGNKDESLYKRGVKHYNNGDDASARALFARLTQEYPNSVYRGAAAFWWGESHFRQGEVEDALAHYERVITSYRREPLRDYALYRAAELQLRRENYDRTAQYVADLRAQYPASPTIQYAHYLAGEATFRQSRFADAVQEFGTFISRYPQSPLLQRATLIHGESLYQLGRYADAQEAYRRFIDRYADSSMVREARYGLAWTQLKQGQVEQAQREFKRLQEQSAAPRYAEAMQYADFVLAAQKSDDRAARRQLQLLSQSYPESPLVAAAWGELAWLRFDGQAYDEALNLYRQLVQSPRTPQPARDVAQFMMGESLYQLSRYAEATAALRNVRSDAEAALREKVAFRLGLSLYHQRLHQQASQVLQAFVVSYASSPYRDEALYWLAEAQFHQADYQAALQTSKRLPRDSRLYPYALHNQGWSYLRLHQWSPAIQTFQQIIEVDSQSAVASDALYRIAESYRQLGQSETAQQIYERYLSLYPKGPQAAASELQLTLLTGQQDNVEQKITALERIQRLYPGTEAAIEAQLRLGTTLFQQNRFAEARESFEAFAAAHPNHAKTATVRLRLADTFYNEKQFRDSLIAYRKVTLLHPNSGEVVDARYGVVLSHYRLGEYPPFLNESQDFIRDFPDHALSESVLLQMAEYFQVQNRPQEAIDTYTYMARAYADKALAAKARLRLGELYLSTGKPDQAIAVFEQILQNGQADDLKPDALYGQAQAYEALGDPNAPQRYARVAEAYPESPLAARSLHQAGRLSQTNGAYAQALGYFERIVLSYPHDPLRYDSWLQWGVALLDLKQPERALEVLQEAQQTPDQHIAAQAQWQIGRAHTQAGALQQGTNAYLRVAYLYPNEKGLVSEALRQAARNYVSLGKCQEALTVYDKLLKQTPSVHLQQVIQQEMAGSGCQS